MFLATSVNPVLSVSSVQSLSHIQLCNPMDCSTPGSSVLHYLLEFPQTQVYWVGDAILPSQPLSSPFPPAFNLSQHQGLFQWVSSSHHVTKVLELQLQQQSFQWIVTVDWLDLLAVRGTQRIFSSATIWKHQFSGTKPSLWHKTLNAFIHLFEGLCWDAIYILHTTGHF